MKKVLILEDDPIRHKAFKTNFWHCDMTIVITAQEAIKKLTNNQYDYLFLDHDLGGTQFAPSDENSGYAVAKFLENNPQYKPATRIIIHSLNPDGRKAMNMALPEAVQLPSIWTQTVDFDVCE
jgi:CheY-like chemotaxis protein